jgi:hypothetical protein
MAKLFFVNPWASCGSFSEEEGFCFETAYVKGKSHTLMLIDCSLVLRSGFIRAFLILSSVSLKSFVAAEV